MKKSFKTTFCKKALCLLLAAAVIVPSGGNLPVGVPKTAMAREAFIPVEDLSISLSEVVVGQRYETKDIQLTFTPDNATNKTDVTWCLFKPWEMKVDVESKDGAKKCVDVNSFTPQEPGYIWLRAEVKFGKKQTHSPWTTDGNYVKFFKLTVKEAADAPEPDVYPASFSKEKLKPLQGPIYLGYFRTWHDYWVEAAWAEASNKIGDIPKEVDVVAVFPDYTSDDNPFWEILKNEYVPKLNERGTRVIRTIGIKDIDGRRGVSKTFSYEKNEVGYKALAEEIVKKYVTQHNLDGLDIDFEYHDSGSMTDVEKNQAKAVIREISKLIGPLNSSRGKNLLFVLDTNKNATDDDGIFKETMDCYDYVMRQTYSGNTYDSAYDTYGAVNFPKEKFMVGFSYYEENGNKWNNVPSSYELKIADEDTNETEMSQPDELFTKDAFKNCTAYRQASYVAQNGFGGIIAYAVERDGVAHGNDKKFFKLSEKGHPSKYFYSQALKHLMLYESNKDVTELKLTEDTFTEGGTLELTARVLPEDATNQEITWSVIAEKTTAKDAAITDGNKLTAKGAGKVAVKAVIENGKKGETVPAMLPFEAEFEITVAALPFIPSTPSAPVTETKTEETKTEEKKTEETKTEEKKTEETKTEEKKTEEKKVTVTKTVYTEKAITSALKSVPNKVKTEVKFNTKTKSTTITWDKVKGATGYLVYVKDSSNKFKQVKVIKKGKSLKLTQKELKNGKKVCIIAYQTVDGKKVAIGKSKLINIK
ncbi:MAG: EndoS/ChiA family endoglycosidase [Acetivibrio ethanolgignens]